MWDMVGESIQVPEWSTVRPSCVCSGRFYGCSPDGLGVHPEEGVERRVPGDAGAEGGQGGGRQAGHAWRGAQCTGSGCHKYTNWKL